MAKYTAKREKEKNKLKKNKTVLIVLICSILAIASIGITSALVLRQCEAQENILILGNISCEVQTDYSIKNTGNTNEYIRAEVIVNWVDENGNIHAIEPQSTITTRNRLGKII